MRLLSPEAFGVVGMVLIMIGLGKLIGDLGFGAVIIQRASLTQKHIRAAFTGRAPHWPDQVRTGGFLKGESDDGGL